MKGNNKMSTCRILFHRLNNITLVFGSIVFYKFIILDGISKSVDAVVK